METTLNEAEVCTVLVTKQKFRAGCTLIADLPTMINIPKTQN